MDRRSFVKAATVGAAACATGLSPLPVQAIEPIKRNGKPKVKFSLAAYSYRGLLSAKKGEKPELTLHDFIDDCATFGLEGTELTSYYFPAQPTAEYIRDLKAHAFRLGLDVSGTAIRNDFCLPPGTKRDADIAHVKKWCAYAEQLSAPVIRIFAGRVQKGTGRKGSTSVVCRRDSGMLRGGRQTWSVSGVGKPRRNHG